MIPRPFYVEQIRPFIGTDVIKIVTGIRRSGKSTILAMIEQELKSAGADERDLTTINFESYANRSLKNPDVLYSYLSQRLQQSVQAGAQHHLFFDEIQEVYGWEQLLTGIQAEFKVDIYITGSNAHFLSSEFATYLSGRYVEFNVLPFSFAEFCAARRGVGLSESTAEAFDVYRQVGGFPFVMQLNWEYEPCMQYLSDIYNTVVLKDMIEREEVGDARQLDALLPFLLANVGHTFSARSIERILRAEGMSISVGTVLNHIEIARRAHFLFKVPRTDAATKQTFRGQEKYYCADVGLREAVYGANDRNIDQVLENLVYLELVRHGWNVSVGRKDVLPLAGEVKEETTGHSVRKSTEIDFVATKAGKSVYIQVSYLLADDRTIEREFAPLEALRIDWPKYVLSLDAIDRSRNGIIHKDLREFLLQADELLW